MPPASGWEAHRNHIERVSTFRVTLTQRDAVEMTRRQLDDLEAGVSLIAAAFQPDERFTGVAETLEERVASVRFDAGLERFLGLHMGS